MKIDGRKRMGIILDTETANDLEDPLVYDVGWIVIDSHGKAFISRSFVNADIFLDEKELMKEAYFSDKIPNYWNEIKSGKRVLTSFYKIKNQFWEDCKNYNCKFVVAHNARFDYKSLQVTQRWLTKSKYRWFSPYNLEWLDTLKMAKLCIAETPSYVKFCNENGFLTSFGKPQLTAEVLFRFISKDVSFVESHTGLEDVNIERQIFAYCRNVKRFPIYKSKLWKD